ncbi:HNH endonuclease [Bacillus cereus group sp. BfR-BA-01309]|uniref:HNH endonuclease n=1 Tax=Bacillus cereus group sp. BfR-BA-01309 TaxID=2920286 RepID=UPI001F586FCC|nr:hypothetical protein [Bacillus cereus group sp. BfR-BA-01309]
MRKLSKPTEKADATYRLCISKVRDEVLKKNLESCATVIVKAADEFEKKVINAQLHTIVPEKIINGLISKEEMNKVYTSRMVPKTSPGRPLYDKLLSAPPHGICPLCGQRIVTTIDHHLPKTEYPALSVVPINLVPSCKDCNTIKLDGIPSSGEEETIHPYFDNIEDDRWLYAEITRNNPITLIFKVCPPDHWDKLLSKRVENHFETFKLAPLYSAHAAVELQNMRYMLTSLFEQAGSESVCSTLESLATSREMQHKNSWQSAMYRTLADSQWFHTEGIQFI